jgi:hypothetical protein
MSLPCVTDKTSYYEYEMSPEDSCLGAWLPADGLWGKDWTVKALS